MIDFYKFQKIRNKEAEGLAEIQDPVIREAKALEMGRKYEELAAENGFITQSFKVIKDIANARQNKNTQTELAL